MFPDNFVKTMDSSVVLRNKKDSSRIRQCRVVFSYNQDHEDELNLNVGDIINIIGEEEEGWWRGVLNGKEGVFPSNFVEEIVPIISKSKAGSREDLTDLSSEIDVKVPTLPAKPTKQMCEVRYSYKAQNNDELSLKEGDLVALISKDGQDPGWWKGELNGKIGVFPDNFVVLVSQTPDEKLVNKDDKKPAKPSSEPVPIKPSSIASQRKSLENRTDKSSSDNKVPPVPSKKPLIAIKKSPSSSGVGLFSEIKRKLVDAVDGATGSKSADKHSDKNADKYSKTETQEISKDKENHSDNIFDQVERRSMLSDVRATRAKAPGRRPPTHIFKEEEGIINGNADLGSVELRDKTNDNSVKANDCETDQGVVKPKLREWEKHKAPWLEEMKLNQAKRTSTSPGPEHRVKLTPTDKMDIDLDESNKITSDVETSPIDMSKSMPSLSSKLKTPPNELEKAPIPKTKPAVPMSPRQSLISSVKDTPAPKPIAPNITKISPVAPKNNVQPQKPATPDKHPELSSSTSSQNESISLNQYTELLERIQKLESTVDELKGKLQVETDMRMLLQAELEKVSQCVMPV